MTSKATRRKFCQTIAGGTAWAIGGMPGIALTSSGASTGSAENSNKQGQTQDSDGGLLSNPRYAVGAKFRLAQFIQRGADPEDAEAILRRLTDLEPQRWVDEWTRLAEPWERKGAEFAAHDKNEQAKEAYQKASVYYGVAKFPVINHPAKKTAYRKCIETYLKAARYFDPPLERVTIPFEGREIIGYLRIPKGVTRPPVAIATGGIDVYKEERDTSDLLDAGMAAFSTDMPGNGESLEWYTADAGRTYSAVIDYLEKRQDLDAKRLGIVGRSYGGYWAGKMAYVESKRIRAAVEWGGPVHYTFQERWLQHLQDDKLYLWPFLDSMVYAHGVKDIAGLREQAATLSLKTQGWLDKPSAPMLVVNGAKDPWITIQDLYLLLESGEPKSARVYPESGHMGAGAETGKLVMGWLQEQLRK
jgi:esterase FrsA